MELNKQIKKFRGRDGYSQEDLAEKLFVSRQTISNWENNRSYPDVHNLMMLSVLFDVSIDELIKGDIQFLRDKTEQKKWKIWSNIMLISAIVSAFLFVPAMLLDNRVLLITSIVLYILAIGASIPIEILKRKEGIYTYRQLIDFYDGKDIKKKKHFSDIVITYLTFPILLVIVILISFLMFSS